MACQACQVALNNGFSTLNLTAHTHDVSQVNAHVTTTQWLKDLTNAMNVAWPKRFRRYLQAAVLMLSWENGDITNESLEFKRLKSVFENEFGYEVHERQIPWTRSGFELNGRVREFVGQYYGPNNLLIVYYAGHARRGDSPGSYPIWFPSQREGVVPEASTIPEANTASISSLLAEGDADAPDVLTLYDCCHPLCTQHGTSRPSNAVIESLCAGGFESEVPMPGPDSFTFALVDELSLAAHSNQPISVPELHKRLIGRLELFQQRARWNRDESRRRSPNGQLAFTVNERRTPVYVSLSVHRPVRTIMLTPIRRESIVQMEVTNPNAQSKLASQDPPTVLLVVRVSEDEISAREEVKTWLLNSPPGVLEFKGFYQSYSTLILVEIALEVWDLLPSCPATTFAGFTKKLFANMSSNAGPSLTQGSQTLESKPELISATKLRHQLRLDTHPELPIDAQSEQEGFFTLLEYLNQIRPKEIMGWKSLHIKHPIETNLPTALFVQFCKRLINDKSVDRHVKWCLLKHELIFRAIPYNVNGCQCRKVKPVLQIFTGRFTMIVTNDPRVAHLRLGLV
ncbi:hypothetical protein PFICI_06326 [Pestalotiopsis fici W106-1]|uniref:Uncharacterized protein n=1 Tax=Pestalotiopsis fici (strain W106-1 / CGMCC3.15140) TaxID=1229662 RepID=W3X5N9_PESFW|nr:uncharacterized protein PFICI_06326 [Pestalotiopsis fici W106-1]ETS81324.1 hypothetical protein PFICI_06326 [Pestalotiopsis fici W106-1]